MSDLPYNNITVTRIISFANIEAVITYNQLNQQIGHCR